MKAMRLFLLINTLFLLSCSEYLDKETQSISKDEQQELKVKLGKHLFYDTSLSIDSTVSCATCHKQSLAFSEGNIVATGIQNRLGKRNVPALTHVKLSPMLNWDGGVNTFHQQALIPIEDTTEMGINIKVLSERLRKNKTYTKWAKKAFNRTIDPYVITQSLKCFLESFPLDTIVKMSEMTHLEKKGYVLFHSEKLNCVACHGGSAFGYSSYSNNGLLKYYNDPGRYSLTLDSSDLYQYRIPSLWNVSITAPYMHDGSIPSLDSVLTLYSQGGINRSFQDSRLAKINFDEKEKKALKAFLSILVDSSAIKDENLSNPIQ
jgi:cytochrome c peroxidase